MTKGSARNWRQRTVPAVSKRTGIPEQALRRMVKNGDVQSARYNNIDHISPDAEKKLIADLGLAEPAE